MTNILKAIYNISQLRSFAIVENYKNSIRVQQAGDSLEYFIKDAFCGSFGINSKLEKEEQYRKFFSYLGNPNNPPDIIIKNGDAIEVKKIEGINSNIALNSSYPKNKLHANSKLITKACRECEAWTEKDIIYSIGTVKNNELLSLWLVYGNLYAAEKEVYERIFNGISNQLQTTEGVEFSPTNELGKVKKIDPLGITDLRVRGMWGIEHPAKLFSQITNNSQNILNAIISEEKYNSFPKEDIKNLENNPKVYIEKINAKNPNNPAKTINSIHIYMRKEA